MLAVAHVVARRFNLQRSSSCDRMWPDMKASQIRPSCVPREQIQSIRAAARSACRFDHRARGRIQKLSVWLQPRTRREICWIDLTESHDVHHRNSFGQKVVGDDAAVTAPPHSLGTHNRAAIVISEGSKFTQSHSERVSCRVIGIVSESGDAPKCIKRQCCSLLPMPQTAESGQMPIGYAGVSERYCKNIGVELRVLS